MKLIGLVLFVAMLMSTPAHSDESELRALARIHQELAHVSKLVRQIEKQNKIKPDARIRFRYDALLSRLQNLQHDIQLHIDWANGRAKTERFNVE